MSANLHMANVVAIFILAFVLTNVNAEYDVAKYCQLVKIGTKLPSFDSCKTYYTCKGSKEFTKHECPDKQVFNKDDAECIPESQSNCKIGVTNPCEGKDQTFATDLENCRMWHWCVGGKSAGKGTCLTGQYFNGTACVNGKCVNENFGSKVGTVTEVKNVCNIMKIGMFFGDFGNCAIWMKCVANDTPPKQGKCDTNYFGYILDVELQACAPFSKAACERTGGFAPSKPEEEKCTLNKKRPDEKVCSKYYKCINSKWTHLSCDNHKYFDIDEENCVDRQKARPAKTCDRCEFSNNKWVNAIDDKCTKFLTCKDGHKVSEGSCGNDAYFNEQRQVCLTGTTTTAIADYSSKNGACECDWECKQNNDCKDKTGNDLHTCKDNICLNTQLSLTSKVNCKIAACNAKNNNEVEDCKINACDEYDDVINKVQCKKSVCSTKCETVCNGLDGDDQIYCKLQQCKNEDCRKEVCDDANDDEEKNKCKIMLCKDDDCKNKICDEITDLVKKSKCKDAICDSLSNGAAKVECKSKNCPKVNDNNADDECQLEACKSHASGSEIVTCKLKYCKTDRCKEKACDDYDDLDKEVICKQTYCKDVTLRETDPETEQTPEPVQTPKPTPEPEQSPKPTLEPEQTSKPTPEPEQNPNPTPDPKPEPQSCKKKACDLYKQKDEEKMIKCKQNLCESSTRSPDTIRQCKLNECEGYTSPSDEKVVKCKLDVCKGDSDCITTACSGKAGIGGCPA